MKLLKTALLLLLALILLASCTSAPEDKPNDPAKDTKPVQSSETKPVVGNSFTPGYVFLAGETEIAVGKTAHAVISALGEPRNKTVSTGCANFDGMVEIVYYYNSYRITTHEMQGEEIITSLYFEDDTIATPEGISLGSDASALSVYGEKDASSTDNQTVFAKGDMTLSFILKEGKVSSILYNLTV